MPDSRFYDKKKNVSLEEVSGLLDCTLEAPSGNVFDNSISLSSISLDNISTLEDAKESDITVLHNKKYLKKFDNTKAIACIVDSSWNLSPQKRIWLLKSKNPYFEYAKLMSVFYSTKHCFSNDLIAPTAKIGNNCQISPNVTIEANVEIGDNCTIDSGVVIKYGSVIGDNVQIGANSVISYSIIGNDVILFPGVSIGQDGFGFATEQGVHKKIIHIGRVIIGNDVEIGANTTIDRGVINDTVIGDKCRIDNLVQIGHNVKLGIGCVMAAQTGIAGSVQVGNYCVMGGQVGIAGHLKIGNYVQIAGKSGVIKDVPDKSVLGGCPALPIRDWHRQSIIMKNMIQK